MDALKTILPAAGVSGLISEALQDKLKDVTGVDPKKIKNVVDVIKEVKKGVDDLNKLTKMGEEALKKYNQPTGSNARDRENQYRYQDFVQKISRQERIVEDKKDKMQRRIKQLLKENEENKRKKQMEKKVEELKKQGKEREMALHRSGIIRHPYQCYERPIIKISNKNINTQTNKK